MVDPERSDRRIDDPSFEFRFGGQAQRAIDSSTEGADSWQTVDADNDDDGTSRNGFGTDTDDGTAWTGGDATNER